MPKKPNPAAAAAREGKSPRSSKTSSGPAKSRSKGRSPVEWLQVVVGTDFLMEVGVFASTHDPLSTIEIAVKSAAEAPAKAAAPKAKREKKEPAAAAAAAPAEYVLRIVEGGQTQIFDIPAQVAAEYAAYSSGLFEARGIHIRKRVPLGSVMVLPHVNSYFLTPRDEVADTQRVYRLLANLLAQSNTALIAHMIRGKVFAPVAIVAAEHGLVLWQLPLIDLAHNITTAIDQRWKTAELEEGDLELAGEAFPLQDAVTRTDLDDPRTRFLRTVRQAVRDEEKIPKAGSTNQHPNAVAALKAIAARRKK